MSENPLQEKERLLTTTEVCQWLEIKRGRLYQLIAAGRIRAHEFRPRNDGSGRPAPLFKVRDVELLADERKRGVLSAHGDRAPQDLTLRAFELFAKTRDLHECVKILNLSPAAVRKLFAEWQTPLGGSRPVTREEHEAKEEKEHAARMRELDERRETRRREHQAFMAGILKQDYSRGRRRK